MKIIGKIFLSTLVCLPPAVVLAKEATGLQVAGKTLEGLSVKGVQLQSDPAAVAASVLSGGFYLLGTIFLALMIYGGFVWGKAAGRDEEVTRARKIITTSLIGMIILLSSYGITSFVLRKAGATGVGAGEAGGGSQIETGCCHTTDSSQLGSKFSENYDMMTQNACESRTGFVDWSPISAKECADRFTNSRQ